MLLNEKTLLAVSLFFSFAGTLALFFVAGAVRPADASLSSLSAEDAGKTVSVKATVKSFYSGPSFNSFSLCSKDCITVLDFSRKWKPGKGDVVRVDGRVSDRNGALSLVADQVEILSRGVG